ncbi:protein-disulfide reductase DsbD domain-containing protein [Neorhizobium sp. NCHU2750]|uniref:protein-disulfide reductase DsbD domain-containing protein n=1 Tax=Neorhizobium sp. NCHU2750 TaxID=1825976 RepID=UPI000E749518|nr:cytochrome c biogenesis protein [Neorhizobium sp. NCHU2750]
MTSIAPALRHLTSVTLLMTAFLTHGHAARAETSDWANNEGGRMRIVALTPDNRGVVRGALQIEPKAGWITYWKEPGDAGIPPHIEFADTAGVSLTRMSYPTPRRIDNGPVRDVGYGGPVTFPFELKVNDLSKPATLTASAFIGLCRNICIPFQADFSLSLRADAGTSFAEAMIINDAEAKLPEAPSDDFAVTHYSVSADGDTLRLRLRLPQNATKKPQVIVTGPDGHVLFGDAAGERDGDSYQIDMPVGDLPKGYDMKGKRWGILVVAGARSMETSLAFE